MHAAKIPAARPHAKSEPSPAFPAFPTRRTKQAVPTARSGCVGTHMKSGHSTMTGITHTHLATQGATYRRERQRGVCARGTFFFARGTVVDAMQQNGVCVLPSSHSAPDLRVGKSARKIRSSRQAAKALAVGRVLQFDRWILQQICFFESDPGQGRASVRRKHERSNSDLNRFPIPRERESGCPSPAHTHPRPAQPQATTNKKRETHHTLSIQHKDKDGSSAERN